MRFIGKCSSCKHTSARDFSETKSFIKGQGIFRRETKVFGRTKHGRFVRASDDRECPCCGAMSWNGKKVQGFVSDHKCDDRCTQAKGHICECSCGGKNHGSGLLVAIQVPV